MSRKDIILISVLINAGLLAVLFVTALKTETEISTPFAAVQKPNESLHIALNVPSFQESEPVEVDEVDQILKEYLPEIETPIAKIIEPPAAKPVKEEIVLEGDFVEVKIKSGDALEKIARANRTTVDAIRKANKLQNDKLKIGQVLRVPVGAAKEPEVTKPVPVIAIAEEPAYYVVKSGDNPWKIAKNHNVKFEDLLILNNLDEERAKNLKVGEKIRVR